MFSLNIQCVFMALFERYLIVQLFGAMRGSILGSDFQLLTRKKIYTPPDDLNKVNTRGFVTLKFAKK